MQRLAAPKQLLRKLKLLLQFVVLAFQPQAKVFLDVQLGLDNSDLVSLDGYSLLQGLQLLCSVAVLALLVESIYPGLLEVLLQGTVGRLQLSLLLLQALDFLEAEPQLLLLLLYYVLLGDVAAQHQLDLVELLVVGFLVQLQSLLVV